MNKVFVANQHLGFDEFYVRLSPLNEPLFYYKTTILLKNIYFVLKLSIFK